MTMVWFSSTAINIYHIHPLKRFPKSSDSVWKIKIKLPWDRWGSPAAGKLIPNRAKYQSGRTALWDDVSPGRWIVSDLQRLHSVRTLKHVVQKVKTVICWKSQFSNYFHSIVSLVQIHYWHQIGWTAVYTLTVWCSGTERSQTLKIKGQGRGWFRGIAQISKVQVKDDITRVTKDVGLGFIVFGTPQSKSQKR